MTEPLDLYVNGTLTTALSLTSDYSWLYGPTGRVRSLVEHARASGCRRRHDRHRGPARLLQRRALPVLLHAGRPARSSSSRSTRATTRPGTRSTPRTSRPSPPRSPSRPGYINVTAAPYNADDTGVNDSTTALQNAINAASAANEGVYIPQGTYKVSQPLDVNNVTIEGAGEWYTTLTGSERRVRGNQNPASTNVNVSNLSIFGEVSTRNNGTPDYTGFNGGFSSSSISDVWIQNEKVGIWMDGPTTGLTINAVRIQDTTADGINLDGRTARSPTRPCENNFLRNTRTTASRCGRRTPPTRNDTVTQNTVDSPGLANNIGIYGGGSGDADHEQPAAGHGPVRRRHRASRRTTAPIAVLRHR